MITKVLLEHGASVNAVDMEGSVPIHFAAWNGHFQLILPVDLDENYKIFSNCRHC